MTTNPSNMSKEKDGATPRDHTTHFDDCGCKSARLEKEIERLEQMKVELWNETVEREKENEALKAALEKYGEHQYIPKTKGWHGIPDRCPGGRDCICGFTEALAQSPEEPTSKKEGKV